MAYDKTLHTPEKPGTCSNPECRAAVKKEYDGKLCYPCAVNAGLITKPTHLPYRRKRGSAPRGPEPVMAEEATAPTTMAEIFLPEPERMAIWHGPVLCDTVGCYQPALATGLCITHLTQAVNEYLPLLAPDWVFVRHLLYTGQSGDPDEACQWKGCGSRRAPGTALCAVHLDATSRGGTFSCVIGTLRPGISRSAYRDGTLIPADIDYCGVEADGTWLCEDHRKAVFAFDSYRFRTRKGEVS